VTALQGKVAAITGGARGIGAAVAACFADAGAAIAILDKDAVQAQGLAELKRFGRPVRDYQADITDADQVAKTFDDIARDFGHVDILVASAGFGVQRPFLETSLEDWNRILGVNLTGAFLCGQAAARLMVQRGGGRIINIASGAGLRGVPGRSAYGASKGGLIILTKVMAAELGVHGITVNAVAPGPIETDLTHRMHTAETRAAYIGATPLHRYGSLDEVARSTLFLASDASAYITGHTLEVDGGMAATGPLFKV
jgi:3-oxoacyl-[acyl-carrier protein] reductase